MAASALVGLAAPLVGRMGLASRLVLASSLLVRLNNHMTPPIPPGHFAGPFGSLSHFDDGVALD